MQAKIWHDMHLHRMSLHDMTLHAESSTRYELASYASALYKLHGIDLHATMLHAMRLHGMSLHGMSLHGINSVKHDNPSFNDRSKAQRHRPRRRESHKPIPSEQVGIVSCPSMYGRWHTRSSRWE